MASPSESQAPVKEGDLLASKYRVEKVLGVGGMGVVVAAHHIELDQRVALKFLLPQAASNGELVERFLREARASVRLKGAHVAKTLDVGRLEDNCPYIVMEFLEGNDLHAELRSNNGVIPIEIAASYVLQAAEGLAEAHSRGIVHRDLKPGNLFLTRGVDGRPLVKVLDFGISKTLDNGLGGEGLSLTRTEMLLGSPLYMSPEQMRSSKHVDERSDLWALGALPTELGNDVPLPCPRGELESLRKPVSDGHFRVDFRARNGTFQRLRYPPRGSHRRGLRVGEQVGERLFGR